MTGQPSTGVRSLIGIGTPANGDGSSRPFAISSPSLRALGTRLVVVAPDDRVQMRVEAVDALERGVDELERAHLLRAHRRGGVECGRELIVESAMDNQVTPAAG